MLNIVKEDLTAFNISNIYEIHFFSEEINL